MLLKNLEGLQIYSEISLRDVALNFSPNGEYNKDYEVTLGCTSLNPNSSLRSELLIILTLYEIDFGLTEKFI